MPAKRFPGAPALLEMRGRARLVNDPLAAWMCRLL